MEWRVYMQVVSNDHIHHASTYGTPYQFICLIRRSIYRLRRMLACVLRPLYDVS